LAFLLTGIPITFAQTLYIAALRMSDNAGMISMINFFECWCKLCDQHRQISLKGVGVVFYGVWKTITESSSWTMIKRKK
jgi:hypothetical protein